MKLRLLVDRVEGVGLTLLLGSTLQFPAVAVGRALDVNVGSSRKSGSVLKRRFKQKTVRAPINLTGN